MLKEAIAEKLISHIKNQKYKQTHFKEDLTSGNLSIKTSSSSSSKADGAIDNPFSFSKLGGKSDKKSPSSNKRSSPLIRKPVFSPSSSKVFEENLDATPSERQALSSSSSTASKLPPARTEFQRLKAVSASCSCVVTSSPR